MDSLLDSIRDIPDSSGIYQYFDAQQRLLYIGKAKSLKKRVKSYFRFTPQLQPAYNLSPRIKKMLSQAHFLKYILTDGEEGALILENSLIKQLKPKYNILLRDDKTFPYIYVNTSNDFPRFEITRKIVKEKGVLYFGPFTSGAREILEGIYDTFPLVQKSSCLKGRKACLFYQIKKCLAPCEGLVDKNSYREILQEAMGEIKNLKSLCKKLEQKMVRLAEFERYEEAAKLRDTIAKIASIKDFSAFDSAKIENLDIISVTTKGDTSVIVRMFMREGKIISSTDSYFKSDEEIDLEEVYERAILNFYTESTPLPPDEILISIGLAEQAEIENLISKNLEKRVKIVTPKIGHKKSLLAIAEKNGEELLRIKRDDGEKEIKDSLQTLLNLQNTPYRIEIFDTSMLFGTARVGSMVVYEDGFIKESYRHYNLESHDDYSMMDEMLKKRVDSFEKNPPPDLWVLDGGKGQLNIAQAIIQSCGANVDVIAIAKEKIDAKAHRAKGAAQDILYTREGKLELKTNDKRLQFLQKLRDEAHRFAIEFHRKQKAKQDKELEVLKAKGVSEAKLKKLLDYFGSFEAIRNAEIEELSPLIGKKSAENLLAIF